MKKFLLIVLVFTICSSCQQNITINNKWIVKELSIVERRNRDILYYQYSKSYDVVTTIDNLNHVILLNNNVKDFKYINKDINKKLEKELNIFFKQCIDLDIREHLDNQLTIIKKLYSQLDSYNKKKISEEVIIINFDNYYNIVYDNDVASCQYKLDCGYLCNFCGIWLHHNWSSFMRLFNSLKVGSIAIIDGHRYKVKSIANGVCDGYYAYNDGTAVPYYTNRYMITCWGFDYGDVWGIRIIEFE